MELRQKIKMATTTQRLDRIEEKIDKLADAMISLARAEEKIASIAQQQAHQTERLNRLSEKIDDIAGQAAENTRTVQLINKLFWVVIAAAAAAVTSNFWLQEIKMDRKYIEGVRAALDQMAEAKAAEGNAFTKALTAAREKGETSFKVGSKEYKVEDFKHLKMAKAVAEAEVKYPHMMYDPKTGKEVTAKTPMDHAKFAKMGYTHEKPKMKESTMTFREKLLSLYEGDRKAHYKGATEPEGMHDKMKSSKGAMDMVNTPKEVAADGKKAADDNATKSAEKKMNKAKKRSGGDNIDKGDTKIVPGGTPVKEPSMAKEEYGMFGKKVSKSLLDAVASVSQVTEKVNKVKGDRSMHDQHAKTGFGMGGEQTYASANGMKQTHYSKYISKKSGHESYFDGKDLVHAKSSKTVVPNALHGKHTPDQLAAKMKAHGDKHKG